MPDWITKTESKVDFAAAFATDVQQNAIMEPFEGIPHNTALILTLWKRVKLPSH